MVLFCLWMCDYYNYYYYHTHNYAEACVFAYVYPRITAKMEVPGTQFFWMDTDNDQFEYRLCEVDLWGHLKLQDNKLSFLAKWSKIEILILSTKIFLTSQMVDQMRSGTCFSDVRCSQIVKKDFIYF